MLIRLALSLVLIILFSAPTFAQSPELPNVLIFIADDLGWGDISPYNNAVDWTPNLQRLADEGTTYTQFYTPEAICTPFRYSLRTGLHPVNDDMIDGAFLASKPNDPRFVSLELTTMPEFLKPLGYHTGLVGKWHLSSKVTEADYGPLHQGYDFYRSEFSDPTTGAELAEPYFEDRAKNLTIAAKTFIRNVPSGEPWYLEVAWTSPHIPVFSNFEGITGAGLYADAVYEIDWSIGEILRYVDVDNTLVMFFADNGPYYPRLDASGEVRPNNGWFFEPYLSMYGDEEYSRADHWGGGNMTNHFGVEFRPPQYDAQGNITLQTGKSSHWEAGVRIAAIIRWIDGEPGAIDAKAHQIMDVYATLEDELGGGITHAVDGANLRTDTADSIFIYTAPGGVGQLSAIILDGRWKYHVETGALYDLSIDPGETDDVAATNAGVVAMIRGKLRGERYLPLVLGE